MSDRRCALCGANGAADPLDKHHVFGGALRKKSEKYGAVVYLCHHRCHIFGADSAHQSREVRLHLKRQAQARIMFEQGWTQEEWLREFGKSYL